MEIAPSTSGSAPTVVSVISSDVPKLKSSVPMMTAAADAPALEARNLYRFSRAGEEETLALRGVFLTVARECCGRQAVVAVLAALMAAPLASARTSIRPAVEELREL
jgi:hypothetical protein